MFRFIKRAQELGFSLKEIKELLALRIAPGSTRADVRTRAAAKIADIEGKVEHSREMKKALVRLTGRNRIADPRSAQDTMWYCGLERTFLSAISRS